MFLNRLESPVTNCKRRCSDRPHTEIRKASQTVGFSLLQRCSVKRVLRLTRFAVLSFLGEGVCMYPGRDLGSVTLLV